MDEFEQDGKSIFGFQSVNFKYFFLLGQMQTCLISLCFRFFPPIFLMFFPSIHFQNE